AEAAHAAVLTLAWNPNPEPDIAGYKIEFGNQPGVHPNVIDVGNQTSWQLGGLTDGLPYYIAVRAYNTSGLLSLPSVEVSRRVGVPFSVRGDFDGDRKTEPAVFRPSTGEWFLARSTSNYTVPSIYQWGGVGDIPVAGDYDGDSKIDPAVYRPSTLTWYALLSS